MQLYSAAQINLGDITPYLTYALIRSPDHPGRLVELVGRDAGYVEGDVDEGSRQVQPLQGPLDNLPENRQTVVSSTEFLTNI